MVRKGGLEPPHLSVPDPKSGASANSATFAESRLPVVMQFELTPKALANLSPGLERSDNPGKKLQS